MRFAYVLLILISGFAPAAELSLKELFEIASQRVESISLQKNQVAISQEELTQLKSNFYPKLSFLSSYTRIAPIDVPAILTPFALPNQYSVQLSAAISGIQGYREVAALHAANADIRAQQHAMSQVKSALYSQVAQAYYNFLSAKQDLKDVQALAKNSQELVSETHGFVKLGRARPSDLSSQQAQNLILNAQVLQAKGNLQLAETALKSTTGIESGDSAAEDISDLPGHLETLDNYVARIDDRPDIKSLKSQVESSSSAIGVAKAGHFPSLGLSADYYIVRSGLLEPSHWDVGLTFTMPLFQGFGVMSQVRQAQIQHKSARFLLEQARRQAEKEIRTAYNTLATSIETLGALKHAAKAARQAYDQILVDYRSRLATNFDLNTALNTFYTTKRSVDQTFYQAKMAYESLRAATGEIQ